jgi:hypothetical protein
MNKQTNDPDVYIQQLPEERKEPFSKLRKVIKDNLPGGFEETMTYGMITYAVPHDLYPAGYHVNPDLPLPFISIASQKTYIAMYHNGIYTYKPLNDWFVAAYPSHSKTRLDMGKSCIRFKKPDQIPYDLIAELVRKMDMEQWINLYEKNIRR